MATKHPGFASVQNKIARQQGVSADRAGAILAASSRNASPAAKKHNPRLKKVGGTKPASNPRTALAEQLVANDKKKAAGPPGRRFLPKSRFQGAKP